MSQLNEYLEYYQTLDKPGYAVLVTGKWGVGKTHQVRQKLGEKSCYVSLSGLQTTEAIHSAVLASYIFSGKRKQFTGKFPESFKEFFCCISVLLKRLWKTVSRIGSHFRLIGLGPEINRAYVQYRFKPDRTLVFDDLERCSMESRSWMGAINYYVEQRGFRVVMITHDKKLDDAFSSVKEKVVGQTIRVEPQTGEAFPVFCEALFKEKGKQKHKAFLENHRQDILDIFEKSKAGSLRILRHLIEDIGRLHETLDEKHLENHEAMVELIRLFSVLDIELRAGSLKPDDLRERPSNKQLSKVSQKYTVVDLENRILQDDTLSRMLVEGCYNKDEIRGDLDNSIFFKSPTTGKDMRRS